MKLEISGVRDRGELSKERIVMKATANVDVGEFFLVKAATRNSTVTTAIKSNFWFPDKEIKAGDFVILYTKEGKKSDKPFKEATSHFFYWGKTSTLWDDENAAAVLMHIDEWSKHIPS